MLVDHLANFTDRESIIAHFEQHIQNAQSGHFHLLVVKGNSGTGKTLLIDYLSQRCLPEDWRVGQLTFAQSIPDFRPILESLEDALKGCVPRSSLLRYREQREIYKRHFDEYRATITVHHRVEAREQSLVSDITQNLQVNVELHRRELHLRSELTRALLELAEESQHPLCLFIDGYERFTTTDTELVGWLWEEILLKLARKIPQSFLVVTCGWHWPDNSAIKPFMHHETLDDFDLLRVNSYLHKQGVLLTNPASAKQQALLTAFYDLTKGQPLVLALAVTYYKELPENERTPASLRANRPLLDERARVEWLNERLLNRLPEPYRTLLERGSILRVLDQAALHILVCAPIKGTLSLDALDNQTYERFLLYPFINQGHLASDGTLTQPIYHDLVRHVQRVALRQHHPETWEQLHRVMAAYYGDMAETEYQRNRQEAVANKDDEWWLAETPEKEFQAQLDYLYHALQVNELWADAFASWNALIEHAVNWWWRQQAGQLLEMIQQLREETNPFLGKTSAPYGKYLLWYSRFLGQEARWEEAQLIQEEALFVFEQVGDLTAIADSLTNIGFIHHFQGNLEEALRYYKRAIVLDEQVGDPTAIADSLTNIGAIYTSQGKLEEASHSYKQALALYKQVGNSADLATLLNNIGHLYQQQGNVEDALSYYERALILGDQIHDPIAVARSLTDIGTVYTSQGKLEEALGYLEQALALHKHRGDPTSTAASFNNLGALCQRQGKLEEALSYFKQALALHEQGGNLIYLAIPINNIGAIYRQQGKLEEALSFYERALAFQEQLGDPIAIANSCHNIAYVYGEQGKWEKAISYYVRSLDLYEKMGQNFASHVAGELEGLAFCYYRLGKREKALPYSQRAQQIRQHLQMKD